MTNEDKELIKSLIFRITSLNNDLKITPITANPQNVSDTDSPDIFEDSSIINPTYEEDKQYYSMHTEYGKEEMLNFQHNLNNLKTDLENMRHKKDLGDNIDDDELITFLKEIEDVSINANKLFMESTIMVILHRFLNMLSF